jgi:hypothetical protein
VATHNAHKQIRVFQDVGNLPLRPPAVFAKAAATLDLLSDGRFEAGLGGGANLEAAWAMGAPALTPGESLDAREEAVAILRASWGDERALRFEGRHYRLGAQPGPKPAHPIGTFVLTAPPDPETLRTFIEDVAPQVQERVATGRAAASFGGAQSLR